MWCIKMAVFYWKNSRWHNIPLGINITKTKVHINISRQIPPKEKKKRINITMAKVHSEDPYSKIPQQTKKQCQQQLTSVYRSWSLVYSFFISASFSSSRLTGTNTIQHLSPSNYTLTLKKNFFFFKSKVSMSLKTV